MKLGLYHSNFEVWVSSLKIIEEFKSLCRIKVTTQKKVFRSFNVHSACTHRIYRVSKTMSEFMFL